MQIFAAHPISWFLRDFEEKQHFVRKILAYSARYG
jgi:hypothetical protein